ncbi:membrane protein insertase YidC [bacterium]|nr:MAG: membrane protein insertase YidC [bacterium]
METKRTAIAMALSVAILVIWQFFFAPPPPEKTVAPTQPQAAQSASVATPAQAVAPVVAAPVPQAKEEARATLRNDLVTVNLSGRGAAVTGASLAKYADAAGSSGKPHQLLDGEADAAGLALLPLLAPGADILYNLVESTEKRAVFAYQSASGLVIEKAYSLSDGGYDLALDVTLKNNGQNQLGDTLVFSTVGDYTKKDLSGYIFTGPTYLAADSLEEIKPSSAEGAAVSASPVSWAGLTDQYFMAAIAPAGSEFSRIKVSKVNNSENVVSVDVESAQFSLAPSQSKTFAGRLYLGPKDKKIMAPLGLGFERSIDYGWFNSIGKLLMYVLALIFSVVGNYGVAIILLTLAVKLIFWPLSAKSYQSMIKMRELQPKMEKLKERYGSDPKRFQSEMMQLYSTHKVNPMSGCLPILVQIPVFFALYKVLLYAIELRHAPFAFWLTDLSAPDPYFVTPVLMGISMFVQQYMTPATAGNETQRKMMMYGMPVLFTWLFKSSPSGLVIYWLMSNVFSIAQQALQMRAAQKPA